MSLYIKLLHTQSAFFSFFKLLNFLLKDPNITIFIVVVIVVVVVVIIVIANEAAERRREAGEAAAS